MRYFDKIRGFSIKIFVRFDKCKSKSLCRVLIEIFIFEEVVEYVIEFEEVIRYFCVEEE